MRSYSGVTFDHIKQECTGWRTASAAELGEVAAAAGGEAGGGGGGEGAALAAALQAAVAPYMADSYPNGQAVVFAAGAAAGGAGPGAGSAAAAGAAAPMVHLCISSSKFSPKNFWNGGWRSAWAVSVGGGAGGGGVGGGGAGPGMGAAAAARLSGSIAVSAHYFEEGNVQMSSSHECSDVLVQVRPPGAAGPADPTDLAPLAAAVVEAVKAEETQFLGGLMEFYEYNNSTTYKELRRMLPVTRTKFAWEQMSHKSALALQAPEMVAAAHAKAAAAAARAAQ